MFLVGVGSRVKLWEVLGVDPTLCIPLSPHHYSLASSKGARVAEVWDSLGEKGGWNPRFVRRFNDREIDMVQSFINTISNKKILPSVKDRLMWKKTM